jgi:hypothetical protein
MPRIMEVDEVTAYILKIGTHDYFSVYAKGKVPTTGWTNIALQPYYYIVPPRDGIMDFDFVGTPPSGIAGQVVLPVGADITLSMPKWLKGVRVHAKGNTKEALLGAHLDAVAV